MTFTLEREGEETEEWTSVFREWGISDRHDKAHELPGIRKGALQLDPDGNVTRGFVWLYGAAFEVGSDDKQRWRVKQYVPKDKVLEDWGYVDTVTKDFQTRYLSKVTKDAEVTQQLLEYVQKTLPSVPPKDYLERGKLFEERLRCFNPFRSKKFNGKLSIHKNFEKYLGDVETAMNVGKAIKEMFPELVGDLLDKVVDLYNNEFVTRDVTLYVSDKEEDFVRAYKNQLMPTMNLETTCKSKSLANSCMRYSFDSLPCHPCSVFASGDFKIYWTENNGGQIGSRCVVYFPTDFSETQKSFNKVPQAAPIYGVCEHTISVIAERLELDKVNRISTSWEGARIKRIEYNGDDDNSFIGPYFDVCPNGGLRDDGKWLIVDEGVFDVQLGSYSGVLSEYNCHCGECGCGMHEDDSFYSDWRETTMCEDCFNDTHGYCEYSDQSYPHEELVEVNQSDGGTAYGYHEHDDIFHYDGEYYDVDMMVLCEYDEEYVPDTYIGDDKDYFRSEGDQEIYPKSLAFKTEEGIYSKEEIDEDEYEFNESTGLYKLKEEE